MLILASKSPRRSQLLELAGIPFVVKTVDVAEIYPSDLDVYQIAPYLAELKAEAAEQLLTDENDLLLTADSVVLIDGKKYGKPRDRDHAIDTIGRLSGVTHTVVTGCCLSDGKRREVFAGRADVTMAPMSRAEIEAYVDRFQPYDKAGAYAIQDGIGLTKITHIQGTFPTVMGLPVHLVYERLAGWYDGAGS